VQVLGAGGGLGGPACPGVNSGVKHAKPRGCAPWLGLHQKKPATNLFLGEASMMSKRKRRNKGLVWRRKGELSMPVA